MLDLSLSISNMQTHNNQIIVVLRHLSLEGVLFTGLTIICLHAFILKQEKKIVKF